MDDGRDEDGLVEAKRALRRRMRAAMGGLGASELRWRSRAVCAAVCGSGVFARARVVAVFSAMESEVDLSGVARRGLACGKVVAWPRVRWESGGMEMVGMERWDWAEAGLGIRGRFGLVEPGADRGCIGAEAWEAGGLVLVPGLAFDGLGGRLGRGAGFYDRFIAGVRSAAGGVVVMGACVWEQVVERVPMGAVDERMDGIVTERGLMLV